ncbi:MAG TPA: DUF6457 domain-containing protein [Acidimicrobiales bacterium]
MTRDEWLRRMAVELGVEPPTRGEVDALLDLAGEAAHASERQAAPLTCWLAAKAGVDPLAALDVARQVAAEHPPAAQG